MTDSLEVQVLYPARWRRMILEALGCRCEAASEESVEQSRDPMDRNRRRGLPGRPDERTIDREVHSHQGPGWQIRRVSGEGGQSCLGRSASCPEVPGLSVFARTAIAAQKSAEGMAVGTPTKPPNRRANEPAPQSAPRIALREFPRAKRSTPARGAANGHRTAAGQPTLPTVAPMRRDHTCNTIFGHIGSSGTRRSASSSVFVTSTDSPVGTRS